MVTQKALDNYKDQDIQKDLDLCYYYKKIYSKFAREKRIERTTPFW